MSKNKYQLKHTIKLSDRQQRELEAIVSKGTHQARKIKRARVLLMSHDGAKDAHIAASTLLSIRTVERIRRRFAGEGGMERALEDDPRPGQPPKLDDDKEAKLVAIACSEAPEGRDRWTLALLQKRLLSDKVVSAISLNAIHEHLRRRGIKPWLKKNVVRAENYA